MRNRIDATFGIGWDSNSRIHRSIKAKNIVLGTALGHLMNGGSGEDARFASTVLDAIGFCNGNIPKRDIKVGNHAAHLEDGPTKDINYLHKLKAGEIYRKHLAKPFMSQEELCEYLFDQTLREEPAAFDLLTKTATKEFGLRF